VVLGIALFKFRYLNKNVLSRLFPQKNRRISFHKSADFLNAFFHSYLCPPAFRYFLSFILPFSVLFRPPSPAFSSNRLFSCRRFKNRSPSLFLIFQSDSCEIPFFQKSGTALRFSFKSTTAARQIPFYAAEIARNPSLQATDFLTQKPRQGSPAPPSRTADSPCAVCLTINFSAHQACLKTI